MWGRFHWAGHSRVSKARARHVPSRRSLPDPWCPPRSVSLDPSRPPHRRNRTNCERPKDNGTLDDMPLYVRTRREGGGKAKHGASAAASVPEKRRRRHGRMARTEARSRWRSPSIHLAASRGQQSAGPFVLFVSSLNMPSSCSRQRHAKEKKSMFGWSRFGLLRLIFSHIITI